jgi:hypothetical protein
MFIFNSLVVEKGRRVGTSSALRPDVRAGVVMPQAETPQDLMKWRKADRKPMRRQHYIHGPMKIQKEPLSSRWLCNIRD